MSENEQAELEEIAALKAQIAAKRSDAAQGERAQIIVDLKARLALEAQHGRLAGVNVSRYVPGQPTQAFLRAPNAGEYKRFRAQVFNALRDKKSGAMQEAQELLARSCWVYPEGKEAQTAMLDEFAGLLASLGAAAQGMAEGTVEEEGKD